MCDDTLPSEVEIAVVGGGFSGIGMAMRLRRMGVESFMVLEAVYDELEERWRLRTSGGTLTAWILIWATGPLSESRIPDLPGLADFGGEVFHSATWDHDYDLRDKRVAVVGTGASAVQFVPQIQPLVAELHLYQRTAPWVLPRHDRPVPDRRRRLFRRFPAVQRLVRMGVYLRLEVLIGPVVLGRSRRRRLSGVDRERLPEHVHADRTEHDSRAQLHGVHDRVPRAVRGGGSAVPGASRGRHRGRPARRAGPI